MKTLKVMSIIGLVLSGLSWLIMAWFSDSEYISDWEAALGWGYIAIFYLIAFSIVVLVQSSKHSKK